MPPRRSLFHLMLLGAFAVTFLVTGTAHARRTCPVLLTEIEDSPRAFYENRALERLGFVPQIKVEQREILGGHALEIKASIPGGREIGEMMLDVLDRVARLHWYEVTDPSAREKGIAGMMFEAALRDHPGVEVLKAELDETNKTLILESIRTDGDCHRAIMASPAARMAARFGFTRLRTPPNCAGRIFVESTR